MVKFYAHGLEMEKETGYGSETYSTSKNRKIPCLV